MRTQQYGKSIIQISKILLLVFDEHIGEALSAAYQQSCDEDALHLAKAAEILWRDIFDRSDKFSAEFSKDSQVVSISNSLSVFVGMLLEGAYIQNKSVKPSRTVLS